MNYNFIDYILIGALAWCILKIFKTYEISFKFFSKTGKDKLPVDYHIVLGLLGNQIKRLSEKYEIGLDFKIDQELIQTRFAECIVLVHLKNYKHELSFNFFNKLKNPNKPTSEAGLQYLTVTLVSDFEDKLVNFLILDNLVSLNKIAH